MMMRVQISKCALVALGLSAGLAALSCVAGASARGQQAPGQRAPAHAYHCTGPSGSSHVTRSQNEDREETLRGNTDIPLRPGLTGRLHVTETATLDERGQLVSARVTASRPRAPVSAFILEPRAGRVRIVRDGMATVEWRVPADAPWIYQGTPSADGLLASTPVAGWVAARASRMGPVVRVLVPERLHSYLVPVDQVAIATESGTTVVLESDGIDVGADFVSEVRLADRSVTLKCADQASDAAS
jgi:hypothetical protein